MGVTTEEKWRLDVATGRILAADDTLIATMRPTCATAAWEADGHLIAAAPQMQKALSDLVEYFELQDEGPFKEVFAALNAANGEPEGGPPMENDQTQTLKILSESLNPQHSAEVTQNAKGELTFSVKVYAADESEAVRRAAAAFEELRKTVKPQTKAAA